MGFAKLFHCVFTKENNKEVTDFLTHWQKIMKRGTPIVLKKNQVLFYEGHVPSGVYVVTSGKVLLTQSGNKSKSVGILEPNQPFGIDLLALNQSYPYSAVAEEDVRAFFITKTELFSTE